MKYIILILLFITSVSAEKFYLIKGVITEDFTKPGDQINQGDSVTYIIRVNDTATHVISGQLINHLSDTLDVLDFATNEKLRNSVYLRGETGGATDLWYIEINGFWNRIGNELVITENTFHGYKYTARGILYDWYTEKPVKILPGKTINLKLNHSTRYDLLGRIKL